VESLETIQALTLQDVPYILLKRKWVIAVFCVLGAFGGLVKASMSHPTYQADVMIQVEQKERAGAPNAEITQMADAFTLTNPTEGEIEILKSRMVLGDVVRKRGMYLSVWPVRSIKQRLLRKSLPQVSVAKFEVPAQSVGAMFLIQFIGRNGRYAVLDSSGTSVFLHGNVGEDIDSSSNPAHIGILVTDVANTHVGQRFNIVHNDESSAIDNLARSLSVEEVGKKTELVQASLVGDDPQDVADQVNDIAESYVEQNIQRRSNEAEERYAYLRQELPGLKASLDSSELRLREYRLSVSSVNPDREVDQALGMQTDYDKEILDLREKRKDALERFTPDHPVVRSIDSMLSLLRTQQVKVDSKMHDMPTVEQHITSLMRESEANADRYSTVLREAHDLEVVRDQRVGDVRIVDRATRGSLVIGKTKKAMILIGFFFGGFLGVGASIGLRVLKPGVESVKLIEALTDKPILCLLPSTPFQSKLNAKIRRGEKGIHLLAVDRPEELAMEALRSSITPLRIAMSKAANNIVMVAGVAPSAGKSFVTANLAVQLAQAGLKVVTVDADLRRGKLVTCFGLQTTSGLSDVLSGKTELDSVLADSRIPNLTLLPSGTPTNKSTIMLQSEAFTRLAARLSERFDLVLVDVPPVLALTDASIVGRLAGTTLLVLRFGAHSATEITACREKLEMVEAKIFGVVLNDVDPDAPVNGQRLSKQTYRYSAAG